MRQRLGDLRAGQTAVDSATQVNVELVIVANGGECSDGHQAAIAHIKVRPPPQIIEHHIVGELDKLCATVPNSSRVAVARAASEAATGSRGLAALKPLVSIFLALYTCS
jgi:hypothetical protein